MLSASKKNGAGNEARTRDLNLGKIASERTQVIHLQADSGTLTHSYAPGNSHHNAATHESVPTERSTPTWWDNLSHEAALIWLCVGVPVLIAAVVGAIYWEQRKVRTMLTAGQYYCHRCRRGTTWTEDKAKCLECPAEPPV